MKVTINGNIKEYYVQTLCLIYFPGSRFSKSGDETGEPSVTVDLMTDDGGCRAKVVLTKDGKEYFGEHVTPASETLSRASMAEKITVGKAFLKAGHEAFGYVPSWGILTGVRPSKLAMKNFENGMTRDENVRALSHDYALTEEKASLAVDVADTERVLIRPEHYGTCSVYVAIPFCPSRCSYCSFVSFTSEKLLSLIPEYLGVLCDEIKRKADIIKELGIPVSSIYIGGGTPTVLTEKQLECLLGVISDNFDTSSLEEFTLEAGRPDTITEGKLAAARSHGVTRISVNTQTLNDDILKAIGRRHTSEDFYRAYDIAVKSGIRDINVDLIAGLPSESEKSFMNSVDRVIELSPSNITVHTFCVKKSADIRQSDPLVYGSENRTAEACVDYSGKVIRAAGYVPYYMYRQKNAMANLENVGYAKRGREGLYNVYMMEEIHSIFAVGASAVSKLVHTDPKSGQVTMQRLFENKYPFEYLSEKSSDGVGTNEKFRNTVIDFYKEYFSG